MTIIVDKLPGFVRFSGKCSQGIVGKCIYNNTPAVWKISKKADFTCESEYEIGKIIADTHLKILPHFVKMINIENVFMSSLDTVKRKCVFMEEIKGGDLLTVILNCGESPDVISLLQQTIISIAAAQEVVDFTHYDLHIENVLVRKTNDDIHVYIFPDGKVYSLETNGLCSVIIDYGFAYTSKSTHLLPSIYHNEIGFMPHHFSPLADTMTLLCSTTTEFKNPESRLLTECKRMFKGMGTYLNWEYGWFEGFTNIPKAMIRLLKPPIQEVRRDSIFRDIPLIVDVLQALIHLPINENNDNIVSSELFTKSFSKLYYDWFLVEENLSNIELEGLLLKTIVSVMKDGKEHDMKTIVHDIMGQSFDIDYEVIKNSLRIIANRIKGTVKQIFKKDIEKRDRIYSKLPISTALDVYKKLKTQQTTYGKDDRVKVFDLRNGNSFSFIINKIQAKKLNKRTLTIEELIFNR